MITLATGLLQGGPHHGLHREDRAAPAQESASQGGAGGPRRGPRQERRREGERGGRHREGGQAAAVIPEPVSHYLFMIMFDVRDCCYDALN